MSAARHPERGAVPDNPVRREAEVVLEALFDLGIAAGVPVRGASMHPTLRDGDRVVASPFLGLPLPGQIVLARCAGGLVVHRLIDVRLRDGRRLYRLQGDAEPGPDAPVRREDLLGRVVGAWRSGRWTEIADDPVTRSHALLRGALRRRRGRLLRGALVLLMAALCAVALVAAAGQEDTQAPSPDYRFAAGDVLSLRIWDGEKIDEMRLTVQSDGEAFMPIKGIGSLTVAGKTVADVKQEIEKRLGAIYKETVIELLITKYAGHRVGLMGEVRTTSRNDSGPGEWPLQGPTHLVSFLSTHGGPGADADLMRIQLIRPSGERLELNLYRAVFQGSAIDDPALDSGDLVYVPSLSMGNRKVYVLGEVNTPGVVNIIDRMGLVEAVARAGGFTRMGYVKGVVVLKRATDGQATMQIADFKEMFRNGKLAAADVTLGPGDIVYVPRRAIATLQEVFSIINPALGAIESIYIIDNFRKQ
jgi:polysaccharide export outer membrane protein